MRALLESAAGRVEADEQKERKTSMDDIARQAAVARGTVYLHAKNKAAVLIMVLAEDKLAALEAFLPALDRSKPAEERLRLLVKASLLICLTLSLSTRLMQRDRELMVALEGYSEELEKTFGIQPNELQARLLKEIAPALSKRERQELATVLGGLAFFSPSLLGPRSAKGSRWSAIPRCSPTCSSTASCVAELAALPGGVPVERFRPRSSRRALLARRHSRRPL